MDFFVVNSPLLFPLVERVASVNDGTFQMFVIDHGDFSLLRREGRGFELVERGEHGGFAFARQLRGDLLHERDGRITEDGGHDRVIEQNRVGARDFVFRFEVAAEFVNDVVADKHGGFVTERDLHETHEEFAVGGVAALLCAEVLLFWAERHVQFLLSGRDGSWWIEDDGDLFDQRIAIRELGECSAQAAGKLAARLAVAIREFNGSVENRDHEATGAKIEDQSLGCGASARFHGATTYHEKQP